MVAAAVKRGLEREGYAVDIAGDGTDGQWLAEENPYDVIILDIMLPGLSGYDLCLRLREQGIWTPLLMLTAKDGELEEARALDSGAGRFLAQAVLIRRAMRPSPGAPPPRQAGAPGDTGGRLVAAGPRVAPLLAGRSGSAAHLARVRRLGIPPAAGWRPRLEVCHPRKCLGLRLRWRRQHRGGLRASPPHQDRPAVRTEFDRNRPGFRLSPRR